MNNTNNKQEYLEERKNNKVVKFVTKKALKETSYKKLFKTNKEEYISTEVTPKKEITLKFKTNFNKIVHSYEGEPDNKVKKENKVENRELLNKKGKEKIKEKENNNIYLPKTMKIRISHI